MSPGMDVSMAEADLQKFGLIDVLRLTFLFNHKIKITKIRINTFIIHYYNYKCKVNIK